LKFLQNQCSFSFEEAFGLLIREIETIRRDIIAKNNNSIPVLSHQHSVGFTSIENNNSMYLIFISTI